jgi:hypothetical protein
MPEPEELPKCPHDDKEFNRDSYLRPTFFSHVENSNCESKLMDNPDCAH